MADANRKGGPAKKPKGDGARFAADDARWGRPTKGEGGRGGKVRLDSRFKDLFTNPDFAETCAPPPHISTTT
jgi:hypothetical protein